jgi:hypothetical protein
MGRKTLSINEQTYEQLAARKTDNDSFDDVIRRLLERSAVDEPVPLTSDDLPLIADEVAGELEDRLTRR